MSRHGIPPASSTASGAVMQPGSARFPCAMCAAKYPPVLLHPVPNDTAGTMLAAWRHGLDRAFEAVECRGSARHHHLEGLVVVISALLATRHGLSPADRPPRIGSYECANRGTYRGFTKGKPRIAGADPARRPGRRIVARRPCPSPRSQVSSCLRARNTRHLTVPSQAPAISATSM